MYYVYQVFQGVGWPTRLTAALLAFGIGCLLFMNGGCPVFQILFLFALAFAVFLGGTVLVERGENSVHAQIAIAALIFVLPLLLQFTVGGFLSESDLAKTWFCRENFCELERAANELYEKGDLVGAEPVAHASFKHTTGRCKEASARLWAKILKEVATRQVDARDCFSATTNIATAEDISARYDSPTTDGAKDIVLAGKLVRNACSQPTPPPVVQVITATPAPTTTPVIITTTPVPTQPPRIITTTPVIITTTPVPTTTPVIITTTPVPTQPPRIITTTPVPTVPPVVITVPVPISPTPPVIYTSPSGRSVEFSRPKACNPQINISSVALEERGTGTWLMVFGSVNYPGMNFYRIDYGAGPSPLDPDWITMGTGKLSTNTKLAEWNITDVRGAYSVRAWVMLTTGQFWANECSVFIYIH